MQKSLKIDFLVTSIQNDVKMDINIQLIEFIRPSPILLFTPLAV